MQIFSGGFLFLVFLVGMFLVMSVKVLNEYERGVIFRLGRIIGAKGPGLIILIPIVDRMVRVDMRTDHAGRSAAGRHHAATTSRSR